MSADGAEATAEQLTAAWVRWCDGRLMTATALATTLLRVGVCGKNVCWPTARLADRMLQKARKAGAIRFEKGRWVMCAEPKP